MCRTMPNSTMTAAIKPVLKASFFLVQFIFLLSTKDLTFDRLEHDIRQESLVSSWGKWENVGLYSSEGGAISRSANWESKFEVVWATHHFEDAICCDLGVNISNE